MAPKAATKAPKAKKTPTKKAAKPKAEKKEKKEKVGRVWWEVCWGQCPAQVVCAGRCAGASVLNPSTMADACGQAAGRWHHSCI
jgi:hypothetical protein